MSASTNRKAIPTTLLPSSVSHTDAVLVHEEEDPLFRLVTYESGNAIFLGIVEDVFYLRLRPIGPFLVEIRLKIRNLLSIGRNGKAAPVRNAPQYGSEVYFACESDLERFFPSQKFPKRGYIGYVKGTSYPMPLDLDKLCFGNTATLAGIGHGKSTLAALVASQLHLMGKKVLVIDPSGEWTKLMEKVKTILKENANLDLSTSSRVLSESLLTDLVTHTAEDLAEQRRYVHLSESLSHLWKDFERRYLTILDVSFTESEGTAEDNLDGRHALVYCIQQDPMREALRHYGRTKEDYGYQACIILEGAHELVPSKAVDRSIRREAPSRLWKRGMPFHMPYRRPSLSGLAFRSACSTSLDRSA